MVTLPDLVSGSRAHQIEVAVHVHVAGSQVVGRESRLVRMLSEVSDPLIQEDHDLVGAAPSGCQVPVAVPVPVAGDQDGIIGRNVQSHGGGR
jgi:hypothetical protein